MLGSAARGRDRVHIQKPLDGRTPVQTDQAAFTAEVLLAKNHQCHQDANHLRTDELAADGDDQEKVGE
jgi:hypothetical protein